MSVLSPVFQSAAFGVSKAAAGLVLELFSIPLFNRNNMLTQQRLREGSAILLKKKLKTLGFAYPSVVEMQICKLASAKEKEMYCLWEHSYSDFVEQMEIATQRPKNLY